MGYLLYLKQNAKAFSSVFALLLSKITQPARENTDFPGLLMILK